MRKPWALWTWWLSHASTPLIIVTWTSKQPWFTWKLSLFCFNPPRTSHWRIAETGNVICAPVVFKQQTKTMFAELLIHPKKKKKFQFNVIYETICATTLWFTLRVLFISVYTLKISRIESNELIFLSRLVRAATFRFDHLPYEFVKCNATLPDVNND